MQYGLEVSSDVAGVAGGLLALSYRGAGVPLRELALVGLTAAIITYFATGPVRMLASRLGAVAYPREQMCTSRLPLGWVGWRCSWALSAPSFLPPSFRHSPGVRLFHRHARGAGGRCGDHGHRPDR